MTLLHVVSPCIFTFHCSNSTDLPSLPQLLKVKWSTMNNRDWAFFNVLSWTCKHPLSNVLCTIDPFYASKYLFVKIALKIKSINKYINAKKKNFPWLYRWSYFKLVVTGVFETPFFSFSPILQFSFLPFHTCINLNPGDGTSEPPIMGSNHLFRFSSMFPFPTETSRLLSKKVW